jgi:hypothetical protein
MMIRWNRWLGRSLPMLVLGLAALALAIFVQPPAGLRALLGLAGLALLAAWALGYPRATARERQQTVERRRAAGERRQRTVEVQAQRRGLIADRRAHQVR